MIRKQFAALPYIQLAKKIEVCLITSRETGRWIIPKGWPEKDVAPHELAAREAYEEAGLTGQTGKKAIGHFHYLKRMADGSEVDCDVAVYPMLVQHQAIDFPEQGQRSVVWLDPKKATKLVDDEELSGILKQLKPKYLRRLKAA